MYSLLRLHYIIKTKKDKSVIFSPAAHLRNVHTSLASWLIVAGVPRIQHIYRIG